MRIPTLDKLITASKTFKFYPISCFIYSSYFNKSTLWTKHNIIYNKKIIYFLYNKILIYIIKNK